MSKDDQSKWEHIRVVNGLINLRQFGAVGDDDLEPEPSRLKRPTGEGGSSTQSPRRACGSEDN